MHQNTATISIKNTKKKQKIVTKHTKKKEKKLSIILFTQYHLTYHHHFEYNPLYNF